MNWTLGKGLMQMCIPIASQSGQTGPSGLASHSGNWGKLARPLYHGGVLLGEQSCCVSTPNTARGAEGCVSTPSVTQGRGPGKGNQPESPQ